MNSFARIIIIASLAATTVSSNLLRRAGCDAFQAAKICEAGDSILKKLLIPGP